MNGSFGDRVGNHFAAAVVVALGLLFLLTSCSSDPTDIDLGDGDLQIVETSDLPGTWTWVQSTGGFAGTTRTPATEGYEASLRFFENGTVEYRVDGELDRSTTWVLEDRTSGPLQGTRVVRYGDPVFGWDEQTVGMRQDGHLVLTDPCCDGFVHEYVRDGA